MDFVITIPLVYGYETYGAQHLKKGGCLMKKAIVSLFLIAVLVTTMTTVGYADTISGVQMTDYALNIPLYVNRDGMLFAFDKAHESKKVSPNFKANEEQITLNGYWNGLFYAEAEYDFVNGRRIKKGSDGNTDESYLFRRTVNVQYVILHKEGFNLLGNVQKMVLQNYIGPWWTQYLANQSLTFYGNELVGERMEDYDSRAHVLLAEYHVSDTEGDWFGLYVNNQTLEVTFCKGGEAPESTKLVTAKPKATNPPKTTETPTSGNTPEPVITPAPPTTTPTPVPVATPVVTPDPETPIVTQAPATPVVVPDPEVPIGAQATPVAVPDKEQPIAQATPAVVPAKEQPIQEAVPVAVPDSEVAIPQSVPDGEEKIG